jgi:protein phosphatase
VCSSDLLEAGDVIILCSDGLNDAVEDNEIETTANDTAPEDLPEVLVKKAIEQGSEDNVTVVVMAIS